MRWVFELDAEGWSLGEYGTWIDTDGLPLAGCLYADAYLENTYGTQTATFIKENLSIPVEAGDNLSFWARVVQDPDLGQYADTVTARLVLDGATGDISHVFNLPGNSETYDSGWIKVSGTVSQAGTITQVTVSLNAGSQPGYGAIFFGYIDSVYVGEAEPIFVESNPGFYSAEIGSLLARVGDLPFDLATPDAMAVSDQGLIAVGASEPQAGEMILVSGDGVNWQTPPGATGHGLYSEITSIRWLKPCMINYGRPTGGIKIPTDTGQVIDLPPGAPGTVLQPGEDGQAPTWGRLNLDDLGDVDTTTTPPQDGDGLVYDADLGLWVPSQVAGGGSLADLSDVGTLTKTEGLALVYDPVEDKWASGPAYPMVHAHTWLEISQKPSTFPPEAHSHAHGALTGLGNDDHPHYYNTARGDARWANQVSTARPGVTKLYRRDADSGYNVQVHYATPHWWLRGYNGDTFHAECRVGWADLASSALGTWEKITEVYLSANGWVGFSPPTSGYKHLMIAGWARSTRNAGHPSDSLCMRFNSNTSSYSNIYLNARADGVMTCGNNWGISYMAISLIEGDLSSANHYAAVTIIIPNYRVGYVKRAHCLPGFTNGDGQLANAYLQNRAGLWGSTAAITYIQLFAEQGVSNNLKAGSNFVLYGSRDD